MNPSGITVLDWAKGVALGRGMTVIESADIADGEIEVDPLQQVVRVNQSAATWTVGMNAGQPLLPNRQGGSK